MTWLIILCIFLSGCANTKNVLVSERDKILDVYKKEQIIILAYEKVYSNTFDIAKNFLQYKKTDILPNYDSFWIWLIKNLWYKQLFESGDEFGVGKQIIDNRFRNTDYQEIRKNYELLYKIYEK